MEFAISLTIENLKQSSYLKCSYLKMGSHGHTLAVSFFRRRARLRSRSHDFHYSIEKRCCKLERYVSFNEIHVVLYTTEMTFELPYSPPGFGDYFKTWAFFKHSKSFSPPLPLLHNFDLITTTRLTFTCQALRKLTLEKFSNAMNIQKLFTAKRTNVSFQNHFKLSPK